MSAISFSTTGCRAPFGPAKHPHDDDAYGTDGLGALWPVSIGVRMAPIGRGYTELMACPPVRV
jgi:hypothetical protein